MATLDPIEIPDGTVVFEDSNVRVRPGDSIQSRPIRGVLQVKKLPLGFTVSWQSQLDITSEHSVLYEGLTTDGALIEISHDQDDEIHIQRQQPNFSFGLHTMRECNINVQNASTEMTVALLGGKSLPTMIFDIDKYMGFLAFLRRSAPSNTLFRTTSRVPHRSNVDSLTSSISSLDMSEPHDAETPLNSAVTEPRSGTANDLTSESFSRVVSMFMISEDEEPGFDLIEQVPELPPPKPVARAGPLGSEEWETYFDLEGRLFNPRKLRERIFRGGCSPEIRPDAWKFLLGVYDYSKSANERKTAYEHLKTNYCRMKRQWESLSSEQKARFSDFSFRVNTINESMLRIGFIVTNFDGDQHEYKLMLHNILMTHIMYDFDLGCLEGMLEILVPITAVIKDEIDSFWCFVKCIDMIYDNPSGSKRPGNLNARRKEALSNKFAQMSQLMCIATPLLPDYFKTHQVKYGQFYSRWLNMCFQREFPIEDVKRLLEILWTRLPCRTFPLLFSLAILEKNQADIIEWKLSPSAIQNLFTKRSLDIKLEDGLVRAEELYFQLLTVPRAAKILNDAQRH